MPVEGTPIAIPVDTPDALCADQPIVEPVVTQLYNVALPSKRRAVFVQQNQPVSVQVGMLNTAGDPVDLMTCDEYDVTVKAREVISTRRNDIFTFSGSVIEPTSGLITVDIPASLTKDPGVYSMEVAIEADELVFSNTLFLWVNRGLFGDPRYPNAGPPSLDEIRLFIRDNAPEENRLLDDFEFDLAEICHAAESAVRYWNEAQPPVNVYFNTHTYPVRHKWLQYIAGHLMLTAAHRFRRNHLPYQAGGIAIDDQNKFQLYDQIGMMLTQEYKEWVKQKKVQINCMAAITSAGSRYGRGVYSIMNTGL